MDNIQETQSPKTQVLSPPKNIELKINQRYHQILSKMILFIISFSYGVQTIWITALMMSYNTYYIVDCFVWIVPNIASIIIRPHLIAYVNNRQLKIHRQSKLIILLLFLGGLGCFITSLSTLVEKQNYVIRIMICIIGWTTMDVCLELSLYFRDDRKVFMEKKFQQREFISDTNIQILGNLTSVVLTICLYAITGTKTNTSSNDSNYNEFEMFLVNCRVIYNLSGVLCWGGVAVLKIKHDLFSSLNYEQINTKQIKSIGLEQYLPGFESFIKSSLNVRLRLLVHFLIDFISDIILIYTTMWVAYFSQNEEINRGESYSIGMRDGSVGLAIFMVLAQKNIFKNRLKYLYEALLIAGIIFGGSSFYIFQGQVFIIFIIICSLCVSIYRNQIRPRWQHQYNDFQRCQQLVERLQKIFVLMVMPSIAMIVMNRDDVEDCLIFGVVGLLICAIILVNAYEDNMNEKSE